MCSSRMLLELASSVTLSRSVTLQMATGRAQKACVVVNLSTLPVVPVVNQRPLEHGAALAFLPDPHQTSLLGTKIAELLTLAVSSAAAYHSCEAYVALCSDLKWRWRQMTT
jgi:hypothetical protein